MSQTKAQLIDPVDGSLVNADINASAAIAGTKISPDFGSQNIVTTGTAATGTLTVDGADTATGVGGPVALNLRQGDANDEFVNLSFQTGTGGPLGVISAIADATGVYPNTTGQLRFSTQVGSGVFERMSIKSDGKVGIGTTSPSSLLNLDGGSSNVFVEVDGTGRYRGFEIHEGGSRKAYFHHDLTGNLAIVNTVEAALAFHTGDTENMRLSGANLGIGTTSPSTLLHTSLAAENGSIATFGLSGQTNNQSFIIKADDSDSLFTFRFGSSNSTYPAVRFNMGADQEAMRIDSSGNVGIGTTSPTSALNVAGRLDVDGLQNQNTAEIVANSTSGQSFGLLVNAGSTSADYCANFRDKDAGAIMILRGDGDIGIGTSTPNRTIEIKKSSPGIRLEETSSGGSKRLEFFVDSSEANIAAPQSAQTIMFSVSGSDTMRLARSGSHAEMFLNCNETFTSAVFSLQTNGTCGIGIKTGATNSQKHISFRNPNGEVGQIVTGSNSTTYDTTSDYRLKENEVAISDGITRLKTLKPYKFNFKNTPSEILDGFYAHEVMTVVPQAVNGEKDEVDSNGDPKYQGIDHSMIVPLIVAAVKELITKVESLEAA